MDCIYSSCGSSFIVVVEEFYSNVIVTSHGLYKPMILCNFTEKVM